MPPRRSRPSFIARRSISVVVMVLPSMVGTVMLMPRPSGQGMKSGR
ncbi:MAG: hypothetical protein OEW93_11885 [Candidatus Bathyarchaeota archaeon]|nr:hypothetical protein [Candidatus Bathyarchaeota archaeon]